jgi:hypothetical protein
LERREIFLRFFIAVKFFLRNALINEYNLVGKGGRLNFAMRSRAAVARRAHNPKVRSSILLFATIPGSTGFFFALIQTLQLQKNKLVGTTLAGLLQLIDYKH